MSTVDEHLKLVRDTWQLDSRATHALNILQTTNVEIAQHRIENSQQKEGYTSNEISLGRSGVYTANVDLSGSDKQPSDHVKHIKTLWGGIMYSIPKSKREQNAPLAHRGQAELDVESAAAFVGPRVTHASLRWIPPKMVKPQLGSQFEHSQVTNAPPGTVIDRRVYPNFGYASRNWPKHTTQSNTAQAEQLSQSNDHVPIAASCTAAFASESSRFAPPATAGGAPSEEYCGDPHGIKTAVLRRVKGPKWAHPHLLEQHPRGAPPEDERALDSACRSQAATAARGPTMPKATTARSGPVLMSEEGHTPGPGTYSPSKTWAYLEGGPKNALAAAEHGDGTHSLHAMPTTSSIYVGTSMDQRFNAILQAAGFEWDDEQRTTRSRHMSRGADRGASAEKRPLQPKVKTAVDAAVSRADDIIRECGASPPRHGSAVPRGSSQSPLHGIGSGQRQGPKARGRQAAEAVGMSPPANTSFDTNTAVAARGGLSCHSRGGASANLAFAKSAPRWNGAAPSKPWVPSSQLAVLEPPAVLCEAEPETGGAPPSTVVYADGIPAEQQDLRHLDSKMHDSDSDEGMLPVQQLSRQAMWRKLAVALTTVLWNLFGCKPRSLPEGLLSGAPMLQAAVDEIAHSIAQEPMFVGNSQHACGMCRMGANPCRHSPLRELVFEPEQSEIRRQLIDQLLAQVPPGFWEPQVGPPSAPQGHSYSSCMRDLTIASMHSVPEWLHMTALLCERIASFCRRDAQAVLLLTDSASLQPALRPAFPLVMRNGTFSTRPAQSAAAQVAVVLHEGHGQTATKDESAAVQARKAELKSLRSKAEADLQSAARTVEWRRARLALAELRRPRRQDKPTAEAAAPTAPGGHLVDTTPAVHQFNLGKDTTAREQAAFGSGAARLAGPVPGATTSGSSAPLERVHMHVVIRIREPLDEDTDSKQAHSGKDAESDSNDSFVSWGGEEGGTSSNNQTKQSRHAKSALQSKQRQASAVAGSAVVKERVLSRRSQADGRILEVAVCSRRPQAPTGPGFAAADAGDSIIRPRQGRGAASFGPPKAKAPVGTAPTSTGHEQAWQQVADIARFGVRLPPTDVHNPTSDARLKRWVSGLSEGQFLDAAEHFGGARLAGGSVATIPAWAAVETAEAHSQGLEQQEQGVAVHEAAVIHGKDTASTRNKVKGGLLPRPPSTEAQMARQLKQAATVQQTDWYKSQLHRIGDTYAQKGDSQAPTKAAFGSTVDGPAGPGPYASHGNQQLPAGTVHEMPGPCDYPGAADMAVFEATGGKRAPAFSFAAPGASTVPDSYAEAAHGGVAGVRSSDPLLEALYAAMPMKRAIGGSAPHANLDRPDRRQQPAFSFRQAESQGPLELQESANMLSKLHAHVFTGVDAESQLYPDMQRGWAHGLQLEAARLSQQPQTHTTHTQHASKGVTSLDHAMQQPSGRFTDAHDFLAHMD